MLRSAFTAPTRASAPPEEEEEEGARVRTCAGRQVSTHCGRVRSAGADRVREQTQLGQHGGRLMRTCTECVYPHWSLMR
jgi:hypothetical protein